jgi:hypothetical protein
MNNEVIQKVLDELVPIFQAADTALSEWTGEGNLQFPVLLGMMAVKLNWDEKQVREADPLVRIYVRRHPDWYVTRGAHGGIMRSAEKQKKEAAKLAKDLAKKQMADAIEAKTAAVAQATNPITDNSGNE